MGSEMAGARIVERADVMAHGVGPILRAGEIADAVIEAISEDNPDRIVYVTDRGDYIRIHTIDECHLTRASLEKYLGRDYALPRLEIEMPSYSGRISTSDTEYRWYNMA